MEYIEFVYNPENVYNCKNCIHDGAGRNPTSFYGTCGLPNNGCWVSIHCRQEKIENKEED